MNNHDVRGSLIGSMMKNYSIMSWVELLAVSPLLRQSFIHWSIFYFRKHFQEVCCELFLLSDSSVIYDLFLINIFESFDNLVSQKCLGFVKVLISKFLINWEKSIFFKKFLIGSRFSIPENERYEFFCVFLRVFESFPYLFCHFHMLLIFFWPLNNYASSNSGHKMLLKIMKRASFDFRGDSFHERRLAILRDGAFEILRFFLIGLTLFLFFNLKLFFFRKWP